MTKPIAIFFSALIIVLTAVSPSTAADTSLRDTLEKSWGDYLKASRSGQEAELQKTMSSFRFGMMKKDLASAGRSFTPDMIRSIAKNSPELSRAEFVTILEKGPTAGLVYAEDSGEKDASGKSRITFIFIKFVKEETGWKVDGMMNMGSPKSQADGKKTLFDPTQLPPTYEIDGLVRKAPEPGNPPDFAALIDIFSYGFKTEVMVNGIKQGECVEASRSGMLTGGLRKGKNTIIITITRTDRDAGSKPSVKIRRVLKDRETEEVFHFEPKENIPGEHRFTVTIDD